MPGRVEGWALLELTDADDIAVCLTNVASKEVMQLSNKGLLAV